MIDEKKLIEDLNKYARENFHLTDEFEWVLEGMLKALDIVERQPKVGEWIPVTELDLDHNQEALIKLDDGFVCSARFLIADNSNYCGFYNKHIGFLQCPQVVEWMPYREKVE